MNKARRKKVMELQEALDGIKTSLQDLVDEETEYLDNMPESFQAGSKGEEAQTHVDTLESAVEAIDEAVTALASVQSI